MNKPEEAQNNSSKK